MDAVEIAKKLVSIPSITGNELAVSEYLSKEFIKLGCKTSLLEVDKNRYNVFAALEGEDPSEFGVIFYGHMDTVKPYGMQDPFKPIIREDCLWGRGSVDQKGGIASVLSAFQQLRKDHVKTKSSIGFLGVVDEEEEHRGIMHVHLDSLKVKNVVITEPSGLKLGVGCKGTVPIKITVYGEAAHGCRPWLGKNAIRHCMKIIDELFKEELPEISIKGTGEARSTLSLGVIEGGQAYNIVPDICTAFFDRRTLPGEDQFEILENIKRKSKKYEQENGIKIDVDLDRPDWHWEPIKKRGLKPALIEVDTNIVRMFKEIHFNLIGEEPIVFFTDGYHEGDFFINDMKIDTVQYGPGDSKYAHKNDEHVAIDELRKASEIYYEVARRV